MKNYTVRRHTNEYTEFQVMANDRLEAYLMVKDTPSKCKVVGGGESHNVINDCDVFETPDYGKMMDLIEVDNDSTQLKLFSEVYPEDKK